MNITLIIASAAVVAVVGILVGFGLGIFGEKFKVEIDEREAAIREALPGNNCGACGFPGCDAMAKAINNGAAPPNGCPVGGSDSAAKIGAILGIEVEASRRMVAFVKCKGDCDVSKHKDVYHGIQDCRKASAVPGGAEKACIYGCMGFGTCVKACEFDAIHVINGVARVDKEKCRACGKCIAVCPNKLIELVPYDARHLVQCNSQNKGKDVMSVCTAGCITCMICVKQCTDEAIKLNGNVAVINYDKCTACGHCAEKCPRKVIL